MMFVSIHLPSITAALVLKIFLLNLLLIKNSLATKDYLYLGHPDNEQGSYVQEFVVSVTKEQEHSDLLPTFLRSNQDESRFVVFYAPWCPHCIHYAPEYIRIAHEIIDKGPGVKFYAVSCTVHKSLCQNQKVMSYPTVLAIRSGTNVTSAVKVERSRRAENFLDTLNNSTTASADSKNHQNFRDVKLSTEKLQQSRSASSQNKVTENVSKRTAMGSILTLSLFGLVSLSMAIIPRIRRQRSGQHKKKDFPSREMV
jgi:thiol-disulfide isomerase/thioredoxin